jgi:pyrimidine nucleoside transport protein
MSAPAALAFAKLFYPETEESHTRAEQIIIEPPQEANVLDAATQGAASSGLLVVNITAIVVAFIAFMAFINGIVAFLGEIVGIDGLSFDLMLGKLFIPLTFLMGVAPDRKSDFSKVAFRAFVSGTMACFLTACIAGSLYDEATYVPL